MVAGAAMVAVAIVGGACVAGPSPPATPPAVSATTAAPAATEQPPDTEPSTGDVFGDAWVAVVERYDAAAIELLISNPLSEYDLVGARLIELLEQTREQLSTLPVPTRLRQEVLDLDAAMGTTLALLKAIDPHGPRPDQAQAYQRALDDWSDHVRPHADAIRDALGWSPVPSGDLQL
jgi:hypothetical protein